MAVLRGRNLATGTYALDVAPIPPSVEGPHDAYHVSLTHNEKLIYSQPHSVHGWQSGHYYVYDIAYAFQCAGRLVDATFDFSIYEKAPNWSIKKWKEPSNLYVSTDWLQFALEGKTLKYRGPLIVVRAFLGLPRAEDSGLERYASVLLHCSPEEAEGFGRTLHVECDAAEERRRELGLNEPEFDETGDDEAE
jgi:hypothetical protein